MADHKNVYEAFLAAQKEFTAPKKTGTNPHFRSKYSTLPDVFNATLAALRKHGLVFTQTPQIADGAPVLVSRIILPADTDHEITSVMPLDMSGGAQKFGSYITYMRRYAAASMFAVVDGMDDDGNAASQPDHPFDDKPPMTEAQRKRMHALGTEVYGDEWDKRRHMIVHALTLGRTSSSSELTEDEAKQVIEGIEGKLQDKRQENGAA